MSWKKEAMFGVGNHQHNGLNFNGRRRWPSGKDNRLVLTRTDNVFLQWLVSDYNRNQNRLYRPRSNN